MQWLRQHDKALCQHALSYYKMYAIHKKRAWEVKIPMEHNIALTISAVFCLHLLMRTCDLTETAMWATPLHPSAFTGRFLIATDRGVFGGMRIDTTKTKNRICFHKPGQKSRSGGIWIRRKNAYNALIFNGFSWHVSYFVSHFPISKSAALLTKSPTSCRL